MHFYKKKKRYNNTPLFFYSTFSDQMLTLKFVLRSRLFSNNFFVYSIFFNKTRIKLMKTLRDGMICSFSVKCYTFRVEPIEMIVSSQLKCCMLCLKYLYGHGQWLLGPTLYIPTYIHHL